MPWACPQGSRHASLGTPARAAAPPPAAQAAAPARAQVLFVSYAHKDKEKFAQDFLKFLQLMVRNVPELGFTTQDIFFDERRILAGDEWRQRILDALDDASAFFYLVSVDALMSDYCQDPELRRAVERDLLIIPVLLKDCPWTGHALPGHARQLRLGDLEAVPKRKGSELVPVRKWGDRDEAWNTVVTQIAAALRRKQAPAPGAAGVPLPPLLSAFCGQSRAEAAFVAGTQWWQPPEKSALVVLVKGSAPDAPHLFWERLRHTRLSERAAGYGHRLLTSRPLEWPAAGAATGLREGVGRALLQAVGAAPHELDGGVETLTSKLLALHGVLPLVVELPEEPLEAARQRVQALFDLLESTPAAAPLERLAIALVVPHAPLCDEPALVQRLELGERAGLCVVELGRLEPLTPEDVPPWYGAQQVQRYTRLDAGALAREIFGTDTRLAFTEFDQRLCRVLQRREQR